MQSSIEELFADIVATCETTDIPLAKWLRPPATIAQVRRELGSGVCPDRLAWYACHNGIRGNRDLSLFLSFRWTSLREAKLAGPRIVEAVLSYDERGWDGPRDFWILGTTGIEFFYVIAHEKATGHVWAWNMMDGWRPLFENMTEMLRVMLLGLQMGLASLTADGDLHWDQEQLILMMKRRRLTPRFGRERKSYWLP